MKFNKDDFKRWFAEGNAEKIGVNKYIEQTTQWKKIFSFNELKKFYIKEYLTE